MVSQVPWEIYIFIIVCISVRKKFSKGYANPQVDLIFYFIIDLLKTTRTCFQRTILIHLPETLNGTTDFVSVERMKGL